VSKSLSLRTRLVRSFTLFGMTPVLLFGLLVAAGDYAVRVNHGSEVLEAVGLAAKEELSNYLASHRGAVSQVADRLSAAHAGGQPPTAAEVGEALKQARGAFPGFLTMLATDGDGIVVAGSPTRLPNGDHYPWAGVDVSDRRYFQVPRLTGRPFLSGVFVGRGFGNDLLCAVSAPVVADDGRLLGVVQGAIRLDGLERLMRAAASQPGVEMMVVDPAAHVAFASAAVPFSPSQSVRDEGWFNSGTHAQARFIDRRLLGAPFGDTMVFEVDTLDGWHVVVMTSRWHLLQRTLIDIGVLLLLVGLVSVVAAAVGQLQARQVVGPLIQLGQRLDSLSLENEPTVALDRSQQIELARLEDAFARMADRVRQSWDRLQDEFATEALLRDELARSIAARKTLDAELSIASEIQKSMVPNPATLGAETPAFDLDALLEPARAVGGDFYDVIAVDEQYTCFYIGDVSDKGVAAALFMARVSTFLEVAARRGEPPGKLLSVVARQIARDNPSEMFATVLCGVIDNGIGTLSLASAGHDPPIVQRADGRIEQPPMETGPALGFDAAGVYPEWHLRLRPGDGIVCYTDGLSEAASPDGAEFGAEGIVEALRASTGQRAAGILAAVTGAVRAHLDGSPPQDDLTLLCLRRPPAAQPARAPAPPPIELEMPNRLSMLPVLSAALDAALVEARVPESVRMDVTLVLEEVLSNTVRHGYPADARDTIRVTARRDGARLHLRFDDGGVAWDPLAHDLPDVDEAIEDREIGGLGVLLVRQLSETAHYERRDGRNQLSLVIRLDVEAEAHA
jgi:serine phosphatase RsbU (regulator of sigma subunit)/anti-sigma regulatory factor (Ser/Thr protein kinase)